MERCRAAMNRLLNFTFPFHFTPSNAFRVEDGEETEAKEDSMEEDVSGAATGVKTAALPLVSLEAGEAMEVGEVVSYGRTAGLMSDGESRIKWDADGPLGEGRAASAVEEGPRPSPGSLPPGGQGGEEAANVR